MGKEPKKTAAGHAPHGSLPISRRKADRDGASSFDVQSSPGVLRELGQEVKEQVKPDSGYLRIDYFTLFWIFVAGCVFGLVVETVFHAIVYGGYESRAGLVWGPFSPLYGLGAVLLTWLSFYLRSRGAAGWQVFLVSALVGGVLEQIAGWSMSTLFDAESWTYLALPDHITQWVAWRFLVAWGVLGLVWCRAVMPRLLYQIGMPTTRRQAVFVTLVALYLVADVAMTLVCFDRKTERDAGVPPANAFEQWVDTNYNDDFISSRFENLKIGDRRDLVDEHGNIVLDEDGNALSRGGDRQ